jgi:ribosomal protein S18 acetylase RimI-like enzyme
MKSGNSATPQIRVVSLDAESPEPLIEHARKLLLEYGRFVVAQLGAAHLCFGSLEEEAAGLPGIYLDQNGGCLIACAGEMPAGFVAWRALPADVAPNAWEMKRLWVTANARGLSLGRTLTVAVLDRARAAHQTSIFLDTVPASMSSAYRLYLELGFKLCAPYNDNQMDRITHLSLTL